MNPFGHWLLAYDHSPHAERALADALAALPEGGKLTLLHVVLTADSLATWGATFEGADQWELPQQLTKAASDELDAVADKVRAKRSDLEVESLVREGEADIQILAVAESTDADLIALGTHSRKGLKHLLMGSIAERVARKSHRPVLLARPHDGQAFPPERILVPLALDGRHPEVDDHLLDYAAELAAKNKSELVLCNVVEPELLVHWGPPNVMMGALNRLRDESEKRAKDQLETFTNGLKARGIPAHVRVVIGTETIPSSLNEILEEEGCGLVVVSSGVREGLRKLGLGSVTRRVAHASPAPVIVLRPPQETV